MSKERPSCDSPFCTLGPCRTAGELIVAAASEVPVGCPNRVERGAFAHRVAEYLTSGQNGLTPSAAAVLASSTRGSHAGSLPELLLSGELTLLEARVRHAIRGGGVGRRPGVEEAPRVAAADVLKAWVKFKVVADATGRPIPGVVLRIRLPKGDEHDYTTRADGVVEIDEINPGMCVVSCYREGARLKGTYKFVAMGDQAVSPLPDPSNAERPADEDGGQEPAATEQDLAESEPIAEREPEFASDGRILVVEEHKVQTGESLKGIAEANGMTWQELAEFNWDTSVPDEINEHLRDDVGCTAKTQDGFNYTFRSEDEPGIIYLPKPWQQDGLATQQTHTIRVKWAGGSQAGSHWEIQLEHDNEVEPCETVTLLSRTGTYRHEIAACDAELRGAFRIYKFPIGPEGRYDVYVSSRDQRYCAWKGLQLPREGQGENERDDDDDAAPPETAGGGGVIRMTNEICG